MFKNTASNEKQRRHHHRRQPDYSYTSVLPCHYTNKTPVQSPTDTKRTTLSGILRICSACWTNRTKNTSYTRLVTCFNSTVCPSSILSQLRTSQTHGRTDLVKHREQTSDSQAASHHHCLAAATTLRMLVYLHSRQQRKIIAVLNEWRMQKTASTQ